LPDHAARTVNGARDLGNGLIRDGNAGGFELLFQNLDNCICMVVGGGENQCFLIAVGI